MHEIVRFSLIYVSSLFIILPLYLTAEFIQNEKTRGIVQNALALTVFLLSVYWVINGVFGYET